MGKFRKVSLKLDLNFIKELTQRTEMGRRFQILEQQPSKPESPTMFMCGAGNELQYSLFKRTYYLYKR